MADVAVAPAVGAAVVVEPAVVEGAGEEIKDVIVIDMINA